MLGLLEIFNMRERTCAACDCKLEGTAISVTLGGKAVEVCCEECAVALREAHAASAGKKELNNATA
jgi:hypothetical protein